MAQSYYQKSIAQKRVLGAVPNLAHPLMRSCVGAWLVNEGSGGIRNLIDGRTCLQANWTANYWGKGSEIGQTTYFPDNSANTASFKHPLTAFAPFSTNTPFTLWVYATPPRGAGSGGYYCRRDGGGNVTYQLATNNDATNHFSFVTQGSELVGTTDVRSLYLDKFYALCGVHDPVRSTRRMYFNRTLEASGASTSINAPTDQIQLIGNDNGNFRAQGSHAGLLMWARALNVDEIEWLATDPFDWVLEPVYRRYFVRAVTIPPQTVSPTGIASEEAHGSHTLLTGAVTLSPTSIASAEAVSTPYVQATVGPTGIASAEAVSTPSLSVTIEPTSIPTAEALGTPTIVIGAVTLSPSGIASAEAHGTTAVLPEQFVTPNGIASAETFGTPILAGGLQYLWPQGIESESWGYPRLVGGSDAPFFLVNGTDFMQLSPSGIELHSAKITKQINSFAQASFTIIDHTGTYRPEFGQEVRIGEFGRTEFTGFIKSFTDSVYDSTSVHQYEIQCVGYSETASRRIYSTTYPVGSDGWRIVVDLVKNGLSGEGVTYNHVEVPYSVFTEPLTYVTKKVNEILDSVRDWLPSGGYSWWIDDFKDMHFHHYSSAMATLGVFVTPFDLDTNVGPTTSNYRKLKVSFNGTDYRNVQYVRANKNFGFVTRIETTVVTADNIAGSSTVIPTQFPINATPTVTINGSPITVVSVLEEPYNPLTDWGYIRGGVNIANLGVALSIGDTVVIEYNSVAVNTVVVEDAAAIAIHKALVGGSGRVENVFEVKDVTETQALGIAQGLLDRHSTLGLVIRYETDDPSVQLGLTQSVNLSEYGISGDFLITQLDSEFMENDLGLQSSYRRQVTLSNTDSSGNPFQFLGQLIVRTNQGTVDIQHEKATLVVTDGAITMRSHAGPPYQVKRDGIITAVTGSIAVPPAGDLIRIDVLVNGVSIFKEDQQLEIRTSALADEIISNGVLNSRNLIVRAGDVITFDILNEDDGTARDLSVVVTMETPN